MPEASFLIRDYRPADIPRILFLIKTAFAEQRGQVDPPSSAERKTIAIVETELQKANALVIEADGEIVACIFYGPKSDSVYIDRLAVLPGYRRHGLGGKLMKEAERRALELGFKNLSLSVRIELKQQQEYYSKMGYEITSLEAHEGFDRPTYVVMRKTK